MNAVGQLRPVKDCPHCQGVGFMMSRVKPGGPPRFVKCICLIQQEAIAYLTPQYASAKWNKAIPVEPFRHKNLLFRNYKEDEFQGIVKSFLLNTGMVFTHLSLTARDVVDASIDKEGHFPDVWKDMRTVDIFILLLDTDPHNSQYALYLMSLCKERQRQKKVTWVWSRWSLQSATFHETYGSAFANFLEDPEAHFCGVANRD
jgi:hypothetical protein